MTTGELGKHTHHLKIYDAGGQAGGGGYIPATSYTAGSVIVHTGSNESMTAGTYTDRGGTGICYDRDQMNYVGSDTPHNNTPTYCVTYCYRRTS